jgi:hypothetical protein
MSDSFEKRRRQREKQRRKKEKAQRKKERDSRKGEGTIEIVTLEDLVGSDAPGAEDEPEEKQAPEEGSGRVAT